MIVLGVSSAAVRLPDRSLFRFMGLPNRFNQLVNRQEMSALTFHDRISLALFERRYLATKDFEWYFATLLPRSVDDRVAALRELPGRFATVRKIAEDTPNLDLASVLPEPAATNLEPALM